MTIADVLAEAHRRIAPRLAPEQARRASGSGAVLVDLRSQDERRRDGIIPGSIHIPLSVLQWRVDPDSGHTNPYLGGLDRQLVLFCAHGFSSSLAAANLRDLGCSRATDIVGGFEAWKATGQPVRGLSANDEPANGQLPGMGPPAPTTADLRRETRWQLT